MGWDLKLTDPGVFGKCFNVGLDAFEPTAGFEVGKGLLVETRPVVDAAVQEAGMDEIKVVFFKRPRLLSVVDLEDAVGRNPGRLDGRDVGSDYFGGGILIRHVT